MVVRRTNKFITALLGDKGDGGNRGCIGTSLCLTDLYA